MRYLKVTLAYDGTDFSGWQRQSKGRTIQGVLEEQIGRMHKHEVPIIAAGRTDSGVHAHGQVITFHSDLESLPLSVFPKALNGFLPRDISVSRTEEVAEAFHPRYDAVRRTYKYFLDCRAFNSPFEDRFTWRIGWKPDIGRLNAFARWVEGTHDFSTFSVVNEQVPNRVRTVYTSVFFPEGPFLVYQITGASFLWRMVRSLVGSMISFEHQGLAPETMRDYLKAQDRSLAGPTAPARGLFLHHVTYKNEAVLF